MMHYNIRQDRRNSLRPWSLTAFCNDCGYSANDVRCATYRETVGAAHFLHHWGCHCIPQTA